MRSKKSDNEGNTSKVSASQLSKTKMVAPTTKPKAENKGKSPSLGQAVERQNGAGIMHAQTEHSICLSEEELQARIANRAYELYEHRGWQNGDDLADWFQAAKEVLTPKNVG